MLVNVAIAAYFGFGLLAPASSSKTIWLPGETTHGHYQIEMDCNACHDPARDADEPSGADVMQDACIRCHGEQLKLARDTHPAKKFRDPTNAALLKSLDAQNCLSCHREHVAEQTREMGLTMPADYCWHCHQEVADSRPSHRGLAFDSCAKSGCHNYHDNRALYEKFLDDHHGQPDHLDIAALPLRQPEPHRDGEPLSTSEADHSIEAPIDPVIMQDWEQTAHAAAGVNCSHCHHTGEGVAWSDKVTTDQCGSCHAAELKSFQTGKHGMRLALGLPAMTPAQARLPMHSGAEHVNLDCNACHAGHRFDTRYAAAEACLQCHADDHSLAYIKSSHADLWADEIAGRAAAGSGVSCASCHLPRLQGDDGIWVNHDQNANLRPSETMARQVCTNCHSLEYSLSSLSEARVVESCFSIAPSVRNESVQMAHDWFEQQAAKRNARKQQP